MTDDHTGGNINCPLIWGQFTRHNLEQCTFARAVGTDDHNATGGLHSAGDIVEHQLRVIVLAHTGHSDRRLGRQHLWIEIRVDL